MITVIPAYGRDYTTAKAAQADWAAGKDFIIADSFNRWDGKPINKEAAESVTIRYNEKRHITVVEV